MCQQRPGQRNEATDQEAWAASRNQKGQKQILSESPEKRQVYWHLDLALSDPFLTSDLPN